MAATADPAVTAPAATVAAALAILVASRGTAPKHAPVTGPELAARWAQMELTASIAQPPSAGVMTSVLSRGLDPLIAVFQDVVDVEEHGEHIDFTVSAAHPTAGVAHALAVRIVESRT